MQAQYLTYKELSEKLGIKLASVRQLVRRKRWRTVKQNDGKTVKIEVPIEALEHRPAEPEPQTTSVGEAVLQERIIGLERALEAERRTHDALEKRATAAEADRDAWKEKANRKWWKFT